MSAEHQRAYKARYPDRVKETEHRYRQTEKGKAARLRNRDAWRKRYPDRTAAQAAVTKAVMRGSLERQPCERCGEQKSQAHHHLGYAYEHRLDVVWLCDPHHKAAHRLGAA